MLALRLGCENGYLLNVIGLLVLGGVSTPTAINIGLFLCHKFDDIAASIDVQTLAVNNVFLLCFAYLIYTIQIDMEMIFAWSVRSKNISNILLSNLVALAKGGILFYLFRYGFAFR